MQIAFLAFVDGISNGERLDNMLELCEPVIQYLLLLYLVLAQMCDFHYGRPFLFCYWVGI